MLGVFMKRWKPKRNSNDRNGSSGEDHSLSPEPPDRPPPRGRQFLSPIDQKNDIFEYESSYSRKTVRVDDANMNYQTLSPVYPMAPNICVEGGRIEFVRPPTDSARLSKTMITTPPASPAAVPRTTFTHRRNLNQVTAAMLYEELPEKFDSDKEMLERRIRQLEYQLEEEKRKTQRERLTIAKLQNKLAKREGQARSDAEREKRARNDSEARARSAEVEAARVTSKLHAAQKEIARVKSQIKPIGTFEPPTNVEIPPEIDWRTKGAVTGVKAQGICGACWAFSTTGALEGQVFIKTGKLLTLSEQNLIDCSRSNYGNNGCDGGVMDNAFTYIKENKGIDDENRYPYEAVDDKDCRYTEDKKAASDSGFYEIASGDEEALMKAVATVGPISVAIQAMDSIKYYNGGVYYESGCSTDENDLNHAVLLVGYGNDTKSGEYWLVKNSWDTSYGEEGYIRMARNRGNNCGIATHAVYPKV